MSSRTGIHGALFALLALTLSLMAGSALGAPDIDSELLPPPHPLPPTNVRTIRDVAYGDDGQQRFDVYVPKGVRNAPVIFMVHGGGWRFGDKSSDGVVENKVAHWAPQGFIVISANYRMLPNTRPLDQARDVAHAIATAQDKAAQWGGDRTRFILMGHSAGAHLVALLASAPSLSAGVVRTPWLGTIALDSAAYDIVKIMQDRHLRLYDRAFGHDPAYWRSASPYHALSARTAPLLLVCSTLRDDSCPQARAYADKAASLGSSATVLPQALSHRELNVELGAPGAYTAAVDSFIRSLDVSPAHMAGAASAH